MKKLRLLTLLGVILVTGTLAGCLDKKGNPGDIIIEDITDEINAVIDYNDTLVELADNCAISESSVWTAYNSEEFDVNSVISAIDNTLNTCNSAINQIESLGDWEGDASLKDGIIALLQKDVEYYNKFKETIPYLATNEEELTEEQANIYDTLVNEIETIDQELQVMNNNLISIQDQFAANHGYELEDMVENDSNLEAEENLE